MIISKLITEIRRFSKLQPNWDGYDGFTPSQRTIINCVTFIQLHFNHLTIPPQPSPSGDGEVSLFWVSADLHIDMGFIGDGCYSVYVKFKDDCEFLADDLSIYNKFPSELKIAISML